MGFKMKILPEMGPCIQAFFLGVFIPAASAIIPVQRVLNSNLNEALDVQRSKVSGTIISFIDSSKTAVLPLLLIGGLGVAFGTTIYFFFPRAAIEYNISLIIQIFFLLLLGMIFGM